MRYSNLKPSDNDATKSSQRKTPKRSKRLTYSVSIVLLCATVKIAGAVTEGQGSGLRSAVSCGPNAIYMFLILCGVQPSEESTNSIVCGAKGASLLELSRFAGTQGVATEIRVYEPSEFRRIPLPAICQTRGGTPQHFLVAYAVDETGIHALDATTGEYRRIRQDRIETFLSGYALVRKPSMRSAVLENQYWVCLCLLVANLFLLLPRRRTKLGRSSLLRRERASIQK